MVTFRGAADVCSSTRDIETGETAREREFYASMATNSSWLFSQMQCTRDYFFFLKETACSLRDEQLLPSCAASVRKALFTGYCKWVSGNTRMDGSLETSLFIYDESVITECTFCSSSF